MEKQEIWCQWATTSPTHSSLPSRETRFGSVATKMETSGRGVTPPHGNTVCGRQVCDYLGGFDTVLMHVLNLINQTLFQTSP